MMMRSRPILLSKEIRAVESRCAKSGVGDLMQRAGLAAANSARSMLGDTAKSVLVLAGPGNNGGDAFEAACHLKKWFFRVTVFFAGNPAKLPPDAKAAYAKWMAHSGATISVLPSANAATATSSAKFDLIVDGLFGIGLKRAPEGIYAGVIETANRLGVPILALDVPSGIDADTGLIPAFGKVGDVHSGTRASAIAIRATRTVTFIALKPGLLMLDGAGQCGEIELASLDIDAALLGKASGHTVGTDLFAQRLQPRRRDVHKGDMGSVGIIGGAAGMTGAALLAARAALKLGAGRVYCGLLSDPAPAFDPSQLELMLRPAGDLFEPGLIDAMVVGPGMGQSGKSTGQRALLARALASAIPLVLDADALNLIAQDPKLAAAVATRDQPTLITPHPGEAARLLGISIAEVQADRMAATAELALRFHCPALLKGAGSVVALDAKRWFINTTGNAGMASAGMGDVLAGMLGTLLAQQWPAEQALLAGVHLHACAADDCVSRGVGPAGLTATEVAESARAVFNGWCQAA